MEVARLLRKTNRHPENGSAFSFARHNSASESMPLRKSTASTATRIRICGVICSMTYDAANARINSASALVPMAFNSSRNFAPCGDSTSTRQLVSPRSKVAPAVCASSSTKAGAAFTVLPARRCRRGLRAWTCTPGSNRSVHFCRLGRSTSNASAVASIPSRRANFAAAAHNSSGSRDLTGCVLRNSSNRRPNCSTSSRWLADPCVISPGLPPSTQPISQAQPQSCMLTGNSQAS